MIDVSKKVYISADYDCEDGDSNVAEILNKWGKDNKRIVEFIDMAKVVSGSVSEDPDCRACDLKNEFNKQINVSSVVIFIVGDKTRKRKAGSICPRVHNIYSNSKCTPYKGNANGLCDCKVKRLIKQKDTTDINYVNDYSYLQHEFEQAKFKGKDIIILYNSSRKENHWLPSYMSGYEEIAEPFWVKNEKGSYVENYKYIKKRLGYE